MQDVANRSDPRRRAPTALRSSTMAGATEEDTGDVSRRSASKRRYQRRCRRISTRPCRLNQRSCLARSPATDAFDGITTDDVPGSPGCSSVQRVHRTRAPGGAAIACHAELASSDSQGCPPALAGSGQSTNLSARRPRPNPPPRRTNGLAPCAHAAALRAIAFPIERCAQRLFARLRAPASLTSCAPALHCTRKLPRLPNTVLARGADACAQIATCA